LLQALTVVVILVILFAVILPFFAGMKHRAKRAELPANVDGIKTAELAYDAAYGFFVAAEPHPEATPGAELVPWGEGNSDFRELGWSPDGPVRGVYEVRTVLSEDEETVLDFQVIATCDIDEDGVRARYTATRETNGSFGGQEEVF